MNLIAAEARTTSRELFFRERFLDLCKHSQIKVMHKPQIRNPKQRTINTNPEKTIEHVPSQNETRFDLKENPLLLLSDAS